MSKVLHPFLLIFARVTHHEPARMVQYLKVENAILRSKLPKVVQVTPRERARLVKYGKAVGDKIKELIQIVTPRTFARWMNGETGRKVPAKKGRPRTARLRQRHDTDARQHLDGAPGPWHRDALPGSTDQSDLRVARWRQEVHR